jgi:Uma2 family endonuclease
VLWHESYDLRVNRSGSGALKRPRWTTRSRPRSPDDVLLIVEVSDSSLRYDRTIKVPLYARNNIPEVWIVDVSDPRMHVFHPLEGGRYTHISSMPDPGRVVLHSLPGASVDLAGLLEKLV